MNRPIRRLALVLFAAFGVIVLMATYLQAIAGPRYRDDPRNARVALGRAGRERGPIISADGVVLATSVADAADPRLFRRSYPEGPLYAHVVGYATALFGDTGLEDERASVLTSGRTSTISGLLTVLTGGDLRAQGLRLTVDHGLQQVAADALGDQTGAVVALDPRTGAVLALVSQPSFDPNSLVGAPAEVGEALDDDPARPLLARAVRETYPPGSTFKAITAAAALEAGAVNLESPFPDPVELELPGSTATIRNFDRGPCGDGGFVTFELAFVRSCNTVFGALGMELGAPALVTTAETFGFNDEVPFDLAVAPSAIPPATSFGNDLPALAQSAIGQRDVRATPFQMALVAAAVANGGTIMRPHVVATTFDRDGFVLDETEPTVWRRAVSPATADVLGAMMERVVTSGTGTRAAVPGVRVAGKTGTAEVPGGAPHAWFIGFAPIDAPEADRQIAVAVFVESGGEGGEAATGGAVAAPIGARVLAAWLTGGS